MVPSCDEHQYLRRDYDKLRIDHNSLYERVRDNEAKYMPAVEAAYRALENSQKVKEDMLKHTQLLKSKNEVQDVHMSDILKRLDAGDIVRETHLALAIETSEALHLHMLKEETERAMYVKWGGRILIYVVLPLVMGTLGFMGWLGLQVVDIKVDLAEHHVAYPNNPSALQIVEDIP